MDDPIAKKKNWFRRHKLITVAALVLALALIWEVGGKRLATEKPVITPQSEAQIKAQDSKNSQGGSAVDGSSTSGSGADSASGGSTAGGTLAATPVPAAGGSNTKMTVANSKAATGPGGTTVVGQITNNQSSTKSANVQATFYDKSGGVLGTAKGAATDIGSDQTKTFTLTSKQDVSAYDRMVVEVTSIN